MKHLLFLLFLVTSMSFAQGKKERIKALKTAHITEALNLTPGEAEKFWPIYNAQDKKAHQLRKRSRKELFHAMESSLDELSDEEADALIAKELEFKRLQLTYHQELIEQLKGVISSKKILKLHKAEEDFKRRVIERIKDRKRHK